MTIFRSRAIGLLVAAVGVAAIPAVVAAQAAVPETHTVRPGDTLWGLAREYFGDPLLWPEIYRQNTLVVEDPHWIYPGEVLRLSGGGAVAAVPAERAPQPEAQPSPAPEAAAPAARPEAEQQPEQVPQEEERPYLAEAPQTEVSDTAPLFPSAVAHPDWSSLRQHFFDAYRPLTRSMFYSVGWLTEYQALPLGQLVAFVTPMEIGAIEDRRSALLFAKVTVKPPAGATYQTGDTLLLLNIGREVESYGYIVHPLGLVRVTDGNLKPASAEIIAIYAAIRPGQNTLPVEKFPEFGSARAVPISDGVEAKIVAIRDHHDLVTPTDVIFIDRGRKEGVGLGDLFEARRQPNVAGAGADAVPEVLAVFQVLRVGEHTASLKAKQLSTPAIAVGTMVRQIAKLPS